MTNEAIEAAARAILLAETEDDMGLLCDQLTEWEAYHAARAAAPALMAEGARLALEAMRPTMEQLLFLYAWKVEGMNIEQARIHAKAAADTRMLNPAAIVKGAGHDRD